MNIRFLLILIFCLASLLNATPANATSVFSSNPNPPAQSKVPTKVWIDTYLFDIDDFNLMKGSYEMIFYMGVHCSPTCNNLNLEFINGKEESIEIFKNTPTFKYFRITARLSQDLDFHQYPFEKHLLDIIVEDKYLDKTKLEFFPNLKHSGLNKDIDLLGWSEEPTWSAKVVDFHYPNYNETNSRYIYTMEIVRPILAGVLKNIVPGVFIMLVGFLTMFLDANKAVNGLAIASGALIAMILLHLANIANIPENDYMTYLDGFMIINYLGLLLLLAELIMLINSSEFTHTHYSLFKFIRSFTPVIWLLLQIINILVFFA